jgi:hypothetical protein
LYKNWKWLIESSIFVTHENYFYTDFAISKGTLAWNAVEMNFKRKIKWFQFSDWEKIGLVGLESFLFIIFIPKLVQSLSEKKNGDRHYVHVHRHTNLSSS